VPSITWQRRLSTSTTIPAAEWAPYLGDRESLAAALRNATRPGGEVAEALAMARGLLVSGARWVGLLLARDGGPAGGDRRNNTDVFMGSAWTVRGELTRHFRES